MRPCLDSSRSRIIVAEVDGVVVGWTSVDVVEHFYLEPYVGVSGLVVDAAYRGKGVGKRLIRAVEDWARAQGLAVVRLSANVARTDAHGFYDRNGFTRVKTQYAFMKRL